jgi:preprotein translocase subunit SecF
VVEPEPAVVPAAKRSGWKAVWISLLCLFIATVLLFGAFMAVAHLAPELLDTILYTPEELEILNYQ